MPMVIRTTGLGRSTIYKLIAEDKFPRPVRVGGRAVAWRRTDIDRWSQERPLATHWGGTEIDDHLRVGINE